MPDFPRKKADELAEAHGHLQYFSRLTLALEMAIVRMESDLKIAKSEKKKWEGRIEKMEGVKKAIDSPVAEGEAPESPKPRKGADQAKGKTWPGEERM